MPIPPPMPPGRLIRVSGCLVLFMLVFTACLLPFLFVEMMQRALENLHLSPMGAIMVAFGIILGSLVNIPIYSIPREDEFRVRMIEPFGGWELFPQYYRVRRETIVAVNVGGCIIPLLLAGWLLPYIFRAGDRAWGVLLVGVAINSLVCYRMARPIPNLGIALPAFVPPIVALLVTWIGLGDAAFADVRAPVAFVIGISGPLIGADLLHWRDFTRIAAGMVSVGGAGTWDGIVLSGLLAAFVMGPN